MCESENRRYRDYLYMQDKTLTLDGCCQSYPLDRDYWNNQLLDRNFLIDYPTIEHIKYPISEGLCMGDSSYANASSRNLSRVWTIEEEGLLDGVSCQEQRISKQKEYWLRHDTTGSCPSQGMPVLDTDIGQRLIDPCTKALDVDHALNRLEKKRLENQCCPSPNRKGGEVAPWLNDRDRSQTGNRRNVDAESALMGINYLNNADCYQNKICARPTEHTTRSLQAASSNLYTQFFQDTNCIYPNYTPKFWDNLTRARSGSQLISSNCPF